MAALLTAAVVAGVLPGVARAGALPLGAPTLPEARATRVLARGVTLTHIQRGVPPAAESYTVSVAFTAAQGDADALAMQLAAEGVDARVETITQRAPDDPAPGALGYAVRSGSFATQGDATALRDRLVAAGHSSARVDWIGEDGGATTGPWVVQVLTIDVRRFRGSVTPVLGSGIVPGREKVTSIATRLHATAAVNGGYFVVTGADGTEGDLAGVSVVRGRLASEAVAGRTSLVLPNPRGTGARIDAVWTRDTVRSSDGASRELDGVERGPGSIRACGGVGGDQPTLLPKHDFTCADASEIIRYTSLFGPETPSGDGAEAVLDAAGRVTALREPRGGPIPVGGSVLAGTGGGGDWLRAHARPGRRVEVHLGVRGATGPLPLRRSLGIVNGGPRLLRAGRPAIDARAEGFVWSDNPEFFWRFGVRRNPRTMAGITRDGRLLLVTVDGHAAGYSVGAGFSEEARIMEALGARDAVNLDGGGSTTMTVGGQLVNRPSDATGERPVGDAIVLRR
ncbi:MAG: hypothetical protein QOF26_1946 [Baekduia sp.]|nr:hypothetical protein [Baekduia sp.]